MISVHGFGAGFSMGILKFIFGFSQKLKFGVIVNTSGKGRTSAVAMRSPETPSIDCAPLKTNSHMKIKVRPRSYVISKI